MRFSGVGGIMCVLAVLAGCSSVKVVTADPPARKVDTPRFEAMLQPQATDGRSRFDSFRFVITNKSEKPFSIDWDDTYYLIDGRRQGQFGWEGMSAGDLRRLQANPIATVAPGASGAVVVFPVSLIAAPLDAGARLGGPGPEGRRVLGFLPEGVNGMELTVQQDGGQFRETLTVRVKAERR